MCLGAKLLLAAQVQIQLQFFVLLLLVGFQSFSLFTSTSGPVCSGCQLLLGLRGKSELQTLDFNHLDLQKEPFLMFVFLRRTWVPSCTLVESY